MIMWLYVHIVFIISGPYLIKVLAIACYECNQFPNESKSPCPATKTVNYGLMYDVSVFLMLYDYYWCRVGGKLLKKHLRFNYLLKNGSLY